jgi:hypothetical protein
MNTAQKGSVRYIVFKDDSVWYAVGLEFNIVESGKTARAAYNNLLDAIDGYVESIAKIKGSRLAPLNQKPSSEYEKLWTIVNSKKKIKSPYIINSYGVANLK